jgi:hypothetical protein
VPARPTTRASAQPPHHVLQTYHCINSGRTCAANSVLQTRQTRLSSFCGVTAAVFPNLHVHITLISLYYASF